MGAKLLSIVLEGGRIQEILQVWQGGYYFHGGLVGGIAGYALYLRFTGNRIRDGLDWAAPFVSLGEAIARIGCFLSGCCWGTLSHGMSAVVYPARSHAWHSHIESNLLRADAPSSLPVHPAPLYASLLMLSLYVGLRLLQPHRRFPGHIVLYYLASHSAFRVALEFIRDDMPRQPWGWTMTQTATAGMFFITAFVLVVHHVYHPFRPGGTQPQEDSLC